MPEKKQSWEDNFEEKMKKLETRIDEIGKTVEEKGEAFGKRIEEKAVSFSKEMKTKRRLGTAPSMMLRCLMQSFIAGTNAINLRLLIVSSRITNRGINNM